MNLNKDHIPRVTNRQKLKLPRKTDSNVEFQEKFYGEKWQSNGVKYDKKLINYSAADIYCCYVRI